MGDTPINLNSPEQLSWVIYGRKVIDKQYWAILIDPYMTDAEFRQLVATGTQTYTGLMQSSVRTCNGTGLYTQDKKNGEPFAKPSKCPTCGRLASLFILLTTGWLKFKPPSAKWAVPMAFYQQAEP